MDYALVAGRDSTNWTAWHTAMNLFSLLKAWHENHPDTLKYPDYPTGLYFECPGGARYKVIFPNEDLYCVQEAVLIMCQEVGFNLWDQE